MKTLRTIATVLLAAVLVLGPAVTFAATNTMTLTTNQTTYAGSGQLIQVSGTVTPAPTTANSAVILTTKGPMGQVDIGNAPVATGTGSFAYTFVTGGTSSWVTGTYTINGTWGQSGNTATATATFSYTAPSMVPGSGGPASINVQVTASTPTVAGQQEQVGILTSFASNGSLAAATFQTIHYHPPTGALVTLCSAAGQTGCTGTFTVIHKGFYEINFTAPAGAGGYFIHAWTNGPVAAGVSTGQGQGLAQFTVTAGGTTTGGAGPDATQLNAIQATLATMTTTLNGIASSIAVLTTGFGTINSGISGLSTTLNSIQSSVNTANTGISGITSTLSSISNNISTVNGIGAQLTTLTNAVNNNQTYVLVVAALAAITLVLELAILVRKLS
jgi:hypothetical protein